MKNSSFSRQLLNSLTRALVRPYHRPRAAVKSVAIVVPLSSRPELGAEEELSLRHLCHYLGEYDKYLITPPGMSLKREGFKEVRFPWKFFGSAAAHNRLLMWPGFYRAFENYEYILMYHLDSLVLSPDMARWCRAGFDYIGAPWLPCSDTPWVTEARVGNGGFALMKVENVLKVLNNRYRLEPATYWSDLVTRNHAPMKPLVRLVRWLDQTFPRVKVFERLVQDLDISEQPGIYGRNNDFFWSFHATRYLPEFKVAGVEQGLEFAFEAAPRRCLELNHGRLPFGCHAWTKFDRSFWEPYLLGEETFGKSMAEANGADLGATSRPPWA